MEIKEILLSVIIVLISTIIAIFCFSKVEANIKDLGLFIIGIAFLHPLIEYIEGFIEGILKHGK